MPSPSYQALTTLIGSGVIPDETIEERMMTCMAIMASGQNPDGTTWTAGGGTPHGYIRLTATSQTWTVPTGVTVACFRVRGGGAGGGGGSFSAGGGGSAGIFTEQWLPVTAGNILTATIGAGGAGGASGVNGTSAGGTGSVGGITVLTNTTTSAVIAFTGIQAGIGRGGSQTSAGGTQGGAYGYHTNGMTQIALGVSTTAPGSGGAGGVSGIYQFGPVGPVIGGVGGTNGGLGGYAQQSGDPLGSSTTNLATVGGGGQGINGGTATEPGCGGGGGGGNATAAQSGGTGGAGAPGLIEIVW